MKGKKTAEDHNEKELKLLKEKLGIDNLSPDGLRDALKQLTDKKVIADFKIKKEKE
ncbi:hypothetical protein [Marinicrinis lubricantis]|uniref:Uncharacterized protein n=1 Tax=Marinicrinis lubricantis TaxID=2086470 RepID=A0ABW1ILD1_9BACL